MSTLTDRLKAKLDQSPTHPPHLIIEALAGTGKTTTLIEGLKYMRGLEPGIQPSPQQRAIWDQLKLSTNQAKSVCFCAFNKSIATELQRRVPSNCEALTLHSLGLRAVTAAFGRVRIDAHRTENLTAEILGLDAGARFNPRVWETVITVKKLVDICKLTLSRDLEGLASHFDIELNGNRDRVFELVPQVLEQCQNVEKDGCIDFTDMVWLPVVLDLPVSRYDLLLIDEAQDLSRVQQSLAIKAGIRLVFCGDPHQAIYGFAGADSESMHRLKSELQATSAGCVVLPLTVTRRCGRAIVKEAQRIVPELEAYCANCKGVVRQATILGHDIYSEWQADSNPAKKQSYRSRVQDGDMILCRVNAPLISECLKFLRTGRRAEIQGRDILANLISTIKKQNANSVSDLISKLTNWSRTETIRELTKHRPSEARLITIQDRFNCIVTLAKGMQGNTIRELIAHIDSIFTDRTDSVGIKLSTIHKAKGLEARRVFLLEPEGATVPHPMARSRWQLEQEWNLRYVAITRAIEELVFVT